MDHLLQEMYGFSDEQILAEFEDAERDTTPYPFTPDPGEFERIWEDILKERGEEGKSKRKRRFSWKKTVVIALAACLATLGVCFVAVGKKSYFYRMRHNSSVKNSVVFNSDSNFVSVIDEDEAYARIESELAIKPLKMGYVPYGMNFVRLYMAHNNAIIEFDYKGNDIYFAYFKEPENASLNRISDGETYTTIKNKWIDREFDVQIERFPDEIDRYETRVIINDVVYVFYGKIEAQEFTKIIERLTF